MLVAQDGECIQSSFDLGFWFMMEAEARAVRKAVKDELCAHSDRLGAVARVLNGRATDMYVDSEAQGWNREIRFGP